MTEDEFQRIKEAEKEHLRARKRLRTTLEALKRRHRVQDIVQRMEKGARHLLSETESFVEALRQERARDEARLTVLDEGALSDDGPSDDEAEAALRDERAEALVRRYKKDGHRSQEKGGADRAQDSGPPRGQEGPEKTIGRMRPPSPEEEST